MNTRRCWDSKAEGQQVIRINFTLFHSFPYMRYVFLCMNVRRCWVEAKANRSSGSSSPSFTVCLTLRSMFLCMNIRRCWVEAKGQQVIRTKVSRREGQYRRVDGTAKLHEPSRFGYYCMEVKHPVPFFMLQRTLFCCAWDLFGQHVAPCCRQGSLLGGPTSW